MEVYLGQKNQLFDFTAGEGYLIVIVRQEEEDHKLAKYMKQGPKGQKHSEIKVVCRGFIFTS